MSEDLLHGNVLITGATGGLGQALARAFAARGAHTLLSGRRVERLAMLAEELDAKTIAADLSDRAEVTRLAAAAGAVDIFVANAGLPASGHFLELSQNQIDVMLEVNLRSQIALARALVPGMVERRCGHVVFISSLSGKAASPLSSLYNATKFALRGFALGLREDLHPLGVGVSVVLPGFISGAGMFADADATLPRGVGTSTTEQVVRAVLQAITRDRAEVTVAPLTMRIGAQIASVAPGLASQFERRNGAFAVARDVADGQVSKRPQA